MRWIYLAHFVLCLWKPVLVSGQKLEVNILDIAYLTNNGAILNNAAATTSSMIVPIAVKHFNDRYDGILPLTKLIGSCNATLNLFGGIFDDGGEPGIAMLALVGDSRFQNTDIILGPDLSTVRLFFVDSLSYGRANATDRFYFSY